MFWLKESNKNQISEYNIVEEITVVEYFPPKHILIGT